MSKKTLQAAVIGAGAIGLDHIKGFQQHPRVRVAAVADTSAERAAAACEQFHVP